MQNTFERDFATRALTPLIAIRSSVKDTPFQKPLVVTVPVSVATDAYPVCYSFNPLTRELEPNTILGRTATTVTVVLYHLNPLSESGGGADDYYPFFIGQRSYSASRGSRARTDSGFTPGVDDWPFLNEGTWVHPGGQCAGQSISMGWYYIYRKQSFGSLRENTFFNAETPGYWQDDRNGIRFATAIQSRYGTLQGVNGFVSNQLPARDLVAFIRDEIQQTGQPQVLYMLTDFIFQSNVGHAVLCYAADDSTLYIADPNDPGDTREIKVDPVNLLNFIPFGFKVVLDGQESDYSKFYCVSLKNLGAQAIESDFQLALRGEAASGAYGPGSYSGKDHCKQQVSGGSIMSVDNFPVDNPELKISLPADISYPDAGTVNFYNTFAQTMLSASTARAVPYIADTQGGNSLTTVGELTPDAEGKYLLSADPQFSPDNECDFCTNMVPDTTRGKENWNVHFVIYRAKNGRPKWFDSLHWRPTFQHMKLPDSRGTDVPCTSSGRKTATLISTKGVL